MGTEARDLNYLKFFYRQKRKHLSSNVLYHQKVIFFRVILEEITYIKINGLNYEIINQAIDTRLSEDLRIMNFTSEYSLLEDFQVNAGGRFDLINSKMATTSLGLVSILGHGSITLLKSI